MTKESLQAAFEAFMHHKNTGIADGSLKTETTASIDLLRPLLEKETMTMLAVGLTRAASRGYDFEDGIRAAMMSIGYAMFEFGKYIAKLEADEEAFNRVSTAKG